MEYMASPRNVYVIGGFRVEDFANNEFYECDFANNEFMNVISSEEIVECFTHYSNQLYVLTCISQNVAIVSITVRINQAIKVFADFTNVI